jgi:2'-5' RNA ligase
MVPPSYLVDVELSPSTRGKLQAVADEVAAATDVEPGGSYHGSISLPLYGPFETSNQSGVVNVLERVCRNFDIVPYRITGYGHFGDEVLYAGVATSPDLQDLRGKIATGLRPITHGSPKRDRANDYPFHLPLAHDVGAAFPAAWDELTDHLSPTSDEYCYRVRLRKDGNVVRTQDLPMNRTLDPTETMNEGLLAKTSTYLEERRLPDHHIRLTPAPTAGAADQHLRRLWYDLREELRWLFETYEWTLEQVGTCLWNRLEYLHRRLSGTRTYDRFAAATGRTTSGCERVRKAFARGLRERFFQPAGEWLYEARLRLATWVSPEWPPEEPRLR